MNYGVARLRLEFRNAPWAVTHHASHRKIPTLPVRYIQDTRHKQGQYAEYDVLPVWFMSASWGRGKKPQQ